MTARRIAALAGALAWLLTGCVTVDVDLTIAADDTVAGTVLVAVDREAAELAGGPDAVVERLTEGDALFPRQPSAGSVRARPYESDDQVGVEYVLTDVPVGDFDADADEHWLAISRVDDTFVVDGVVDLVADGALDPLVAAGTELTLSVAFPGEVRSADGEVSGRTVTWRPALGERTSIHAVGEDGGPGAAVVALWAVAVGAAVVALVLLVALVRRLGAHRRAVGQPPAPPGEPAATPMGAPSVESGVESGVEPGVEPRVMPTVVLPVGEQLTQVVPIGSGDVPPPGQTPDAPASDRDLDPQPDPPDQPADATPRPGTER